MTVTCQTDKFSRLFKIIKTLRGKKGCPWDRKQTPDTIKKYLLEETRELTEAIDNNDVKNIREELGDLFFILSMIITMYEEKQLFTTEQVLHDICEKMVRRHPHVYNGDKTGNDQELRDQWERIKSLEKIKK